MIGSKRPAPIRNKDRPGCRVEIPGHCAVDMPLGVSRCHTSIDPGQEDAVEGPSIRARRPEFLNDHGPVGERRGDVSLPSGGGVVGLVVVDMGGVGNAVARGRVCDGVGRDSGQVVGPVDSAYDADVVGALGADGADQGVQARRGETFAGGAAIAPHGPVTWDGGIVRKRFVEHVEKDRGVVLVAGGDALPESFGVKVRHGVLLHGVARTAGAGPMEVNVHIDVVRVAQGHNVVDDGLIGGGGNGSLAVADSGPKILVQGQADKIGVPIGDRFLDGVGDSLWIFRIQLIGIPFEAVNIHAHKPHRAGAHFGHKLAA